MTSDDVNGSLTIGESTIAGNAQTTSAQVDARGIHDLVVRGSIIADADGGTDIDADGFTEASVRYSLLEDPVDEIADVANDDESNLFEVDADFAYGAYPVPGNPDVVDAGKSRLLRPPHHRHPRATPAAPARASTWVPWSCSTPPSPPPTWSATTTRATTTRTTSRTPPRATFSFTGAVADHEVVLWRDGPPPGQRCHDHRRRRG